jgi:hypothetical protein
MTFYNYPMDISDCPFLLIALVHLRTRIEGHVD